MGVGRECMRVPEIARQLGISQDRVKRLLHKGVLPGFKVGRVWMMRTETFKGYVARLEGAKGIREEVEDERRRNEVGVDGE